MLNKITRFAERRIEYFRSILSLNYQINSGNSGALGFIDVGSVGGLPPPWRENANFVKFLLNFEPNDKPTRSANIFTYNTALWESDKTLPFYVYKGLNNTGSSLFKQNMDYVKKNFQSLRLRGPKELAETWFDRSSLVATAELKCRALDGILTEELKGIKFHFLKIDAQGAEFNILKGAQAFLSGSCIGLHLELFTLPLYHEIVLLDEVEKYLSVFGFELVKKFPPHGSFNSQHDCLFLKSGGDLERLSIIRRVYGLL